MAEKKKILIVDDEEAFVRLIKLNLEETGRYEVRTETKGAEALAAARTFKPDLILLDVVMPDMNGPEVALKIKADESIRQIPIVFFTAAVLKEARESIQKTDISWLPFIEKPISAKELVAYIEQNLRTLKNKFAD